MAVTFGVTTEAIRRGPLSAMSPLTALSPVITAGLAIALLHERLSTSALADVALAPLGVVLLVACPSAVGPDPPYPGWQLLAVSSLVWLIPRYLPPWTTSPSRHREPHPWASIVVARSRLSGRRHYRRTRCRVGWIPHGDHFGGGSDGVSPEMAVLALFQETVLLDRLATEGTRLADVIAEA